MICSQCKVVYGTGKKTGFCPGCWKLYLAQQEFDIRIAYVSQCESRGVVPRWDYKVSNVNNQILSTI